LSVWAGQGSKLINVAQDYFSGAGGD